MKLITKFTSLKNNAYFKNIYVVIFILLSLLLMLFSFFIFLYDFDTSLFGIDITNTYLDGTILPIGMYLVKLTNDSSIIQDLPTYTISISNFGIFTIVCFALISILFAFYYPIFKNKTIVLYMFYVFFSHLLSTTLLFACFPYLSQLSIVLHDIDGIEPNTNDGYYYIFSTILFDNWVWLFSYSSSDPFFGFDLSVDKSFTWFYIFEYIIYAIVFLHIIFSEFIIIKELFAGKKFFLDSNIKEIIMFNSKQQ